MALLKGFALQAFAFELFDKQLGSNPGKFYPALLGLFVKVALRDCQSLLETLTLADLVLQPRLTFAEGLECCLQLRLEIFLGALESKLRLFE